MPTMQETLDDLIVQLQEHRVIVNGAAGDANEARLTAFSAWQDVQSARINLRSYTDERIQYVLDLMTTRLTALVEDLVDRIADGDGTTRDDAVTAVNDGLTEWRDWIDGSIADIIRDTVALEEWAEDTFNVEIPRLLAIQAEMVEAAEQTEQWMLNEVGRSMQESEETAARWRQVLDDMEDTKSRILNMDYSIYEMREELVRGISVEFNDRLANFEERINVAAGTAGAVADRIQTLEVTQGEQQASVQTLERAFVTATEELAVQITSLSVGTNTQFDSAIIWHFDANVEGWGGSWNNGFLRPGVSSISPVISVDASKYRQVRARIRRVGTPVWAGMLSWAGATPAGPQPIAEPVWDADELGEFTVNLQWSGTLTRMTLALAVAVDASNYFLLDWITVGRPAPGASTAQLDEERRVRIHENGLVANRVLAIEGNYVTEAGLQVVSEAVDGVLMEITDDETGLTALNNRITILSQAINDPNTGLDVTSSAMALLTNRVSLTEQGLSLLNSDVVQMKLDINGKVSSTVYSGLVQRVEDTETGLTTLTSDMSTMNTTVAAIPGSVTVAAQRAQAALDLAGTKGKVFVQNGAPPIAERLPQNLWIDTTADANTPKRWSGTAWVAVTDKVARDAAAAAAAALAGLGSKADASALTGIWNKIDEVEGTLSSEAGKITSLNTSVTLVEAAVTRVADVAVAQLFPKSMDNNGRYWRSSVAGIPFQAGSGMPSPFSFMTESGVDGQFLRIPITTGNLNVFSQAVIPVPPVGRTFRIRIRFRSIGGITTSIRSIFSYLTDTYTNSRNVGLTQIATTVANQWLEYEIRFTTGAPNTGERWMRMGIQRLVGGTHASHVVDVNWLDIDDITDLVAAEKAAADAAAVDEKVALKADASVLETFMARVGPIPNGTESLVSRVTNINNKVEGEVTLNIGEVRDAAAAAALLAGSKGKVMVQATAPAVADRAPQNLWIDTTANANTPKRWNGSAWVAVTDKVATDAKAAADAAQRTANLKADASVVTSLASRVGPLENGFQSATQNIQTLFNSVYNVDTGLGAHTRAITAVENDVKLVDGQLTAVSQKLDVVESAAGAATANGMMRMYTAATPTGAASRVAIQVRAGLAGAWQSAAMFMEANTDGAANVTFVADRFAIVSNGGTSPNREVPFFIKNNRVYMKTALIEDLTVGTLKLAGNSVTQQWGAASSTLTINLAYGAKVIVVTNCRVMGTFSKHTTRYRFMVNGNTNFTTVYSVNEYTYPYTNVHIINLAAGQHTLSFNYVRDGAGEATDWNTPTIAALGAFK